MTLRVPQTRDGEFSTELFQRDQRSEQALVLALMEMVVNGVSTRKITQITEELCGTSFSKSTVSSLCKGLYPMIQNWNQRFLHEHVYPFVLVDANSSSSSSLNKLNKELEQIENRLLEIQQLQDSIRKFLKRIHSR